MHRSPSSISITEAWLTFLFLALVSTMAFRSLVPPAAVPAVAPPNTFSAERAFKHLEFIAREPHPTGSAANARVRDYLIQQLQQQGLEPQVQRTSIASLLEIFAGPYGAGSV